MKASLITKVFVEQPLALPGLLISPQSCNIGHVKHDPEHLEKEHLWHFFWIFDCIGAIIGTHQNIILLTYAGFSTNN